MSQSSLLAALARECRTDDLIKAAVKDVADDVRRANLTALFDVLREVEDEPLTAAADYVDFIYSAHNKDSKNKEVVAEDIVSVLCKAYQDATYAPGVRAESHWTNALISPISKDDVGVIVALDGVGLIARDSVGVEGAMHDSWEQALRYKAARCNRYFLTTTSLSDLGGYPQSISTWASTMEMARDIAEHIPEDDKITVLEILNESSRYHKHDVALRRDAEYTVAAVLERYSHDPQMAQHPVFNDLLSVMIAHTVTGGSPRLNDVEVAGAMLAVMDRCDMLGGPAAFRYAENLLDNDKDGEKISAEYLQTLLDKGLRIESKPEWNKGEDVRHLLAVASPCHFAVLDARVVDREAFMRDFGVAFMRKNAKNASGEAVVQGVKNAALMQLANMGYSFGPIASKNEKGKRALLAVYEKTHGTTAQVDAFLVGHVCGHLSKEYFLGDVAPLHVAVAHGSVATAKALIQQGWDLNAPCAENYGSAFHQYTGMTPLVMALKRDDDAMVKTLLELGVDTAIKSPTGATVMQLAKSEQVKMLIRAARTAKSVTDQLVPAAGEPAAQRRKQHAAPL